MRHVHFVDGVVYQGQASFFLLLLGVESLSTAMGFEMACSFSTREPRQICLERIAEKYLSMHVRDKQSLACPHRPLGQ